jgi:DNA-binding transcriptional ArsR family regulator
MDITAKQPPTEILKALSDPVRWNIIEQMAAVDELACATLEETLPVSKPTISYHTKILHNAGLINVRKSGRNYYYSLRRDALHKLLDDLWELAPMPRPVREEGGQVTMGHRQKRSRRSVPSSARKPQGVSETASTETVEEAVVLTW